MSRSERQVLNAKATSAFNHLEKGSKLLAHVMAEIGDVEPTEREDFIKSIDSLNNYISTTKDWIFFIV